MSERPLKPGGNKSFTDAVNLAVFMQEIADEHREDFVETMVDGQIVDIPRAQLEQNLSKSRLRLVTPEQKQ